MTSQAVGGGGEIDLVFVVDETGSMGSQINQVKQHVNEITTRIKKLDQCKSLRFGLIGYHDHQDSTKVVCHVRVPLTADIAVMTKGVNQMTPAGGADYPEAVTDALYELVRLGWRPNAAKTAVLIADAPPHGVGGSGDTFPKGCPCGESWEEQVKCCREMGVVVHTVACSGLREEWVFEHIAKNTNGQMIKLSMYDLLPSLICGVAECDLDRQRIELEVRQEIEHHINELLAVRDEPQRLKALFTSLSRRGLNTRQNNKATQAVETRPIAVGDVVHAIATLRRKELPRLEELFESVGIEESNENTDTVSTGLFDKKTQTPVPLKSVEVQAALDVGCGSVEVSVMQVFTNDGLAPIEAAYKFPVDETAAVCGFTATIDNKVIVAKCYPKKKAQEIYDDALASGSGAYLLEQKNSALFEMTVGNLPPNKSVTIKLTYVAPLEDHDGTVRFFIPTTVAPAYGTPDAKPAATNLFDFLGPTTQQAAQTPSYALKLNVTVQATSPLAIVESPTHKVDVVRNATGTAASVTLHDQTMPMDSDFVLLVKEESPRPAFCCLEEWEEPAAVGTTKKRAVPDTNYTVAVSFVPQIAAVFDPASKPRDVIALVDCSSSMIGGPIRKAREGLAEFLRIVPDLPAGSRFDVYAFGSETKSLFGQPKPINDRAALAQATEFMNSLAANMGGSQLTKAIKDIRYRPVLECTKSHHLQPCTLHELLVDNVNYRFGFQCDVCKNCEGQPMHCSACEFDLCRACTLKKRKEAETNAATKDTLHCTKNHELKKITQKELATENKNYENGFKCDVCSVVRLANAAEPYHCATCQYDLCSACAAKDRGTCVLLFTDAAIYGSEELIKFASAESSSLAIYPIGLGHGVNQHFIRSIAQASNGYSEFCTLEEDITTKVKRQLRRVFGCSSDAQVEWALTNSSTREEMVVHPVPNKMAGAVLGGSRLTVYAMVPKQNFQGGMVTLKGKFLGSQFKVPIAVPSIPTLKGKTLHRLCARLMIRELEESTAAGENKESSLVELATKYSLASSATSFVAVEEREDATTDVMERIEILNSAVRRQSEQQQQQQQPQMAPRAARPAGIAALDASRRCECLAAPPPPPSASYSSSSSFDCFSFGGAAPSSRAAPMMECAMLSAPACAPMKSKRMMSPKEGSSGFLGGLFGSGGGGRGGHSGGGRASEMSADSETPLPALVPIVPETPEGLWASLLMDCGTSVEELAGNKALCDAVVAAVQAWWTTTIKKLPIPLTSNNGINITSLSAQQRAALAQVIAKQVAKFR